MRVKNEIAKFYNKLSMKVNLPAELNSGKCSFNCKSRVYKIKTMT